VVLRAVLTTQKSLLEFLSAAVVVLALSCDRSSGAPAPAPKPNILLVLADQWRAQAFGFAGDPNVRTPHLDSLQRESIRFVNAFSGMPVCCPYRASLLTGQRPLTHGVFLNDVPLPSNAVSIAKVLSAAGYDTGYIGKWHLDGHGRSSFIPRERRQGFAYWKVLECTHDYTNSFYYADEPVRVKWEGYDAAAQTRDAQQYLRDHAQGPKPFCLFLAWGPPHDPYQTAPASDRELYAPEKIQLRQNVAESLRDSARRMLAGYYAHCTALDDCLGGLLATLRETGLERNTLLVFTSDHGDLLGSQGGHNKQQPYDECIRVPLLMRWPAVLGTKPRRLQVPFGAEDMMPTLLGLCGLPIPGTVEGLNLSIRIQGEVDPPEGAVLLSCVAPFGQWTRRMGGREYRGLRTDRYTYVRDLQGPWLLFDNRKDPYQLDNLANRSMYAKRQEQLEASLREKLRDAHDEFLPGEQYIRRWGYRVDATGTVPYTP
jgi:arylsulfatase A-like enzyme